jgi:hypothetical protein
MSWRILELLAASARITPTFSAAAEAPVPAAPAKASRPASPVASRLGSTIPGRTDLSVATFRARSGNPAVRPGQPNCSAAGLGTASTIGLSATEPRVAGRKPGASEAIRSNHVLESGIQTSTALTSCGLLPTPERLTPC